MNMVLYFFSSAYEFMQSPAFGIHLCLPLPVHLGGLSPSFRNLFPSMHQHQCRMPFKDNNLLKKIIILEGSTASIFGANL